MKRKIAFVLAVLIIVCVVTAASAYWTMYVYTANGKPLNMRNAPSLSGGIMISIPNGTAVRVNDVYNSSWYSVSYAGYTGYCMSYYLVYSTPTCVPLPCPTCVPWPYPTYGPWPYPTYGPWPYPTYGPWPYPTVTPTPQPTATPYTATFPNDVLYGFQATNYVAMVRPSNPAGYVNVRWAPSLQADILARYYANDLLTVISQNALWCQVLDKNENVTGYVMRQFLTPYYSEIYYNPYGNEFNNGDS